MNVRLPILALVAWMFSLPTLGLPVVGPEFGVGPASYVAAASAQTDPAIAFNGTNYLVVWEDQRDQIRRIYGTRVSLSRQVLDPDGLRIQASTDSSPAYAPVVASDGQDFLVIWQDQNSALHSARVTCAGEILTNSINFFGGVQAIAYNSGHYLLTWANNGDIYGARLTPEGNALDPAGFPISTATRSQSSPKVVALGENWLVAWTDTRRESAGYGQDGDVFGTLVSPSGTVLFPDGFIICATNNRQSLAQLCTLGNTCLASWQDARAMGSGINVDVYAARITSAGVALDTNGFAVANSNLRESQSFAATDGDNWFVLWNTELNGGSQVRGCSISPQGNLGNLRSFATVARQYANPALCFGQNNYFGIWEVNRVGPPSNIDVVGSRITADGVALDIPELAISLSANPQFQPAVASDGTNYLLVWSDGRTGDAQWDIYGARVTGSGQVIEAGGFPIATSNSAQTNPAVAFNGSHYLVVWTETRTGYRDIYGARISAAGQVLDPNGFPIAQADAHEFKPSVASNGDDFLVAWGEIVDYPYTYKVACRRVSATGLLLDPAPIVLTLDQGSDPRPRVASNGTNYFVTWLGAYQGGAATISRSGAILSTNSGSLLSKQQVASNGNGFLLAVNNNYGVHGLCYTAQGAQFTNFQIAPMYYNFNDYTHAVTSDGIDYFLAYSPHGPGDPVYFTQASAAGRVIHTNGILVTTNVVSLTDLALAGNKRNFLVAYPKVSPYVVPRLHAVILDATPRLLNPARLADQFTFTLDGTAERVYYVESTADLRIWSGSGYLTNQNGRVNFSESTTAERRFYRARQID